MSVSVLLLRGINVGGRNALPMAELRVLLEGLGAEDIATYIQSGNAVFRGEVTAESVADGIEAAKGFRPQALVMSRDRLAKVMAANPFPEEGAADGKSVHVWFFEGNPKALEDETLALATPSERVEVTGEAAYLHGPDGIGRSKLAATLEKALGLPATARNWRTVMAIAKLVEERR